MPGRDKTPLQRACIFAGMLLLGHAQLTYGDLRTLFDAQRKRHLRRAWRWDALKRGGANHHPARPQSVVAADERRGL